MHYFDKFLQMLDLPDFETSSLERPEHMEETAFFVAACWGGRVKGDGPGCPCRMKDLPIKEKEVKVENMLSPQPLKFVNRLRREFG